MNPIVKLHKFGQSIWYDNIERRLLKNGELALMIEQGMIRGVTSNPSIFNNAISNSMDYDDTLVPLAKAGKRKEDIYETLAKEDIQNACDLFKTLYDQTEGNDGFVSLEVNPYLANDSKGTIADAKRLWKLVDRPNLMIKIPATIEALPAITSAITDGININVTLIFSISRYEKVMDAYITGLEQRLLNGKSIDKIASVASFFISRIDTNIDNRLARIEPNEIVFSHAKNLKGKAAIANAKIAYARNQEVFKQSRFLTLEANGARIQRALWASTSTKNPEYPDTKYVDELIGPNTVNTIPPQTLKAFENHGTAELTLSAGVEEAQKTIDDLADLNISMEDVASELEEQGVKSFADAYTALIDSIEKRRLSAM